MAKSAKNKVRSSFPPIVTVDPFSPTSYRLDKGELSLLDPGKSGKKDDFFISYISAKEAVTGTIELSKNIPEEELQDAITIKAYDELGLDASINYKFNYVKAQSGNDDQNDNIYSVFAINVEAMDATFAKVNKKVPYIDYITTAPFLIKSLYKKHMLDPYGNECFLFFQKHDAFLAIYQDGQYLYSKSLKYSLAEINEKFSASLGERIGEENFYNLLSTEGLRSSNIEYQQHFMKVFGEVFLHVNDVSVFARRACGINQIDKVYLGTDIGTIHGMSEYVKSYMGTEVREFNFDLHQGETNGQINQMHLLLILTAQLYLETSSTDESLNFTIYRRPPSLDKRPAGKFLMFVAGALLAGMALPTYNFAVGGFNYFRYSQVEKEFEIQSPIAKQKEQTAKTLQDDKDRLTNILREETSILNGRRALLGEIHSKRVYYPMKAKVLVDLVKMVNENGVKLEKISQDNTNVVLSVIGNDEKKITELMDQIANTNRYSIRTKEIIKDDEKRVYRSDITMEIL